MAHSSTPNMVDLFAGPGGIDASAELIGLNPVGIEFDPDACRTRRAAGLATVEGDVGHYDPSEFPGARVLAGGPPCQTYSATGTGTGRRQLDTVLLAAQTLFLTRRMPLTDWDDPRTGLVLQPLRWAIEAKDAGAPFRTIVLEQVPAVLPVWEAFANLLKWDGYWTATGVLRAEQFGAPQSRPRAFLVASLDGAVSLPEPTHRPYRKGVPQHEGDPGLLPWVAMRDVLPHLDPFVMISNYGTGGDPANRGRRTSAEPAPTVTGRINRNRLVRPDGAELPRLTPSEAGQLQGFPADYPWSDRDVWQQIGNACPVPLARAVLAAALAPSRTAVAA